MIENCVSFIMIASDQFTKLQNFGLISCHNHRHWLSQLRVIRCSILCSTYLLLCVVVLALPHGVGCVRARKPGRRRLDLRALLALLAFALHSSSSTPVRQSNPPTMHRSHVRTTIGVTRSDELAASNPAAADVSRMHGHVRLAARRPQRPAQQQQQQRRHVCPCIVLADRPCENACINTRAISVAEASACALTQCAWTLLRGLPAAADCHRRPSVVLHFLGRSRSFSPSAFCLHLSHPARISLAHSSSTLPSPTDPTE